MKRKLKWALSLAMTFTMLVSVAEPATASELSLQEDQSVITAETGSEPVLVTAAEKSEEAEAETGLKPETKPETREEAGEEAEPETREEAEKEAEPETGEETEKEVEPETGEKAGEEAEPETREEAEEEAEPETGEEAGEEAEPETGEEAEEEAEPEIGEEAQEEAEPEWEMDQEMKEESEDLSAGFVDLKDLSTKMSADCIDGVHEHSWSEDWNYDGTCHWHECSAGDCFVTDDSGKDGYAEHNYDDQGVCMECGYNAMEGITVAAAGVVPTCQEVYEAMTALKEKYPEGMVWTNFEPYGSRGELGSAYTWKGGAVYGANSAVGCMAFTFILSDEAFGNLPARAVEKGSFTFEDVKVGDILRIYGNTHSVIVLRKSAGGVTVAEGNFNNSVHWGRAMSVAEVEDADFMITRYPQGYIPEDADDPAAGTLQGEGTMGNLKWTVTTSGVLTISGSGAMPDYSSDDLLPWSAFDLSAIVIEKGVTSIGEYAFYQSGALSVYIPDSVTAIGPNAFCESSLLAVTVPGSVRTIGKAAFSGCENLTSATVSNGVTDIGDEAFHGCTALTHIDFPASITSVGTGAFMSCSKMVSVRFMSGSGTVKMGDNLFTQCWRLEKVTLPQTTDRITAGMFSSCTSLPELYIPAGVTQIGDNVASESPFHSCRYLKVIYYGGSETEWNRMMNTYLLSSLQANGTTVVFDAKFEDPFAGDPDDPGDFQPGESGSCTDHVDADNDGRCDNCGTTMSTEDPGSNDGEKDPAGSGNSGGSGNAGGSGNSGNSGGSGSSGGTGGSGNAGGSGSSGGSGNTGGSGNSGNSGGSGNAGGSDSSGNSGGSGNSGDSGSFGHNGAAYTENMSKPTEGRRYDSGSMVTKETSSAEAGNQPEFGKPFVRENPGSSGWESVRKKTDETEDGHTVAVDMNGAVVVPGDVLERICNKDITIVFYMGNGIVWSVNGKSVGEGKISDIDFSVQTDTQGIPADVVEKVASEHHCMQIHLAHEGEFGFTAVLSIDLGEENAGYTASLYYYNEDAELLEYICADTVAEDGVAGFAFTHASDYVIVTDREQEEAGNVTEPAQSETPDENHTEEAESPQTSRPQSPRPLLLVGVLVLFIGAVAFFMAGRKKEHENDR